MSKTNHRRINVSRRDADRYRASPLGGTGTVNLTADKIISAIWGGCNHHGHRGYARIKRGGKKYVRSRVRFQENDHTRKLVAGLALESLHIHGDVMEST